MTIALSGVSLSHRRDDRFAVAEHQHMERGPVSRGGKRGHQPERERLLRRAPRRRKARHDDARARGGQRRRHRQRDGVVAVEVRIQTIRVRERDAAERTGGEHARAPAGRTPPAPHSRRRQSPAARGCIGVRPFGASSARRPGTCAGRARARRMTARLHRGPRPWRENRRACAGDSLPSPGSPGRSTARRRRRRAMRSRRSVAADTRRGAAARPTR